MQKSRNLIVALNKHPVYIRDLLTNPRWAWFDPVRETDKFKVAVAWVKEIEQKQKKEME